MNGIFGCGTASGFLRAASKQPLKQYLPKYRIILKKTGLKKLHLTLSHAVGLVTCGTPQ